MIIALDYDETYTADPDLWALFVYNAKRRGHTVLFVTYRVDYNEGFFNDNDDIKSAAEDLDIEIVFTSGRQKAGIVKADIWIDDQPITIPVANELKAMHAGCLVNGDN